MTLILYALIGILGTDARLIEKNTGRTLIQTATPQMPPRVRLTRDIFAEDTLTGFSKEDDGQSVEFVQLYNRKTREFFKSNPPKIQLKKMARKPRESNEKVDPLKRNGTDTRTTPKVKVILVKKPIPKYNDVEYDDDFQMKVSRIPVKVADSSEHEDEDFNVDDYDFDVNHDEYISRGKPLEPRVKHKDVIEHRVQVPPKPVIQLVAVPEVKIQSKVIVPTAQVISTKKERAAEVKRKPHNKSKEVEYYDDTTTIKPVEKEKKDLRDTEDEFADDGEDSKESESKWPSRLVRSPWKSSYMDKSGEKSSVLAARLLGILPMFPSIQRNQLEYLRATANPNVD